MVKYNPRLPPQDITSHYPLLPLQWELHVLIHTHICTTWVQWWATDHLVHLKGIPTSTSHSLVMDGYMLRFFWAGSSTKQVAPLEPDTRTAVHECTDQKLSRCLNINYIHIADNFANSAQTAGKLYSIDSMWTTPTSTSTFIPLMACSEPTPELCPQIACFWITDLRILPSKADRKHKERNQKYYHIKGLNANIKWN